MLAQMTYRLHQKNTFEDAIEVILDDAIALHGAECGNIQLPIRDELAIVAQRGLSAEFLAAFRRVKKEDDCACGRAFRIRDSVVIRDVSRDSGFADFRMNVDRAGFRSVQSTPLFTQVGALLGVVSTHFVNVHEPTPIEMKTLKEYGMLAAEYLEKLAGDVPLETKAEEMSTGLYTHGLACRDFREALQA
jgi:GAF domain-containing protein